MPNEQPRFIIVDQSLKGFDGHHYEYDLAVARAAAGRGYAVAVLANKRFSDTGTFPATIVPWFPESSYEAHRNTPAALILRAITPLPAPMRRMIIAAGSLARRVIRRLGKGPGPSPALPGLGKSLAEWLEREQLRPEDHVFIHSLSNAEFLSLSRVLTETRAVATFHVLLRRDAEEENAVTQAHGGVGPALLALVGSPEPGTRLRLYADTRQLAEQYDALGGSPRFGVLPIPHCLDEQSPPPDRGPGLPLRLVYLGNARSEKGFDLLPGLLAGLKKDCFDTGRAKLVAQANIPVSLEEADIARAVKRLSAYPGSQVELLERELSLEAFQDLLHSADVVLLPYRADLYRRRSSGILVQALAAGKPVVVPQDSWLAAEASQGAAVVFGPERSFADAVRHAIENHAELAVAARSAAGTFARTHSADRLVELLLAAR